MAKTRYVMHIAVLVGISAALMFFIFILVAHHLDTPGRADLGRTALLSAGVTADVRIQPVASVEFAESTMEAGTQQQEPEIIAAASAAPVRDGQQVYQTSCVACHGAGIAGAPKVGDKGQWSAHIAKGIDTLYQSAINGFQSSAGVMPPKGGNMGLSDAEVKSAVDHMVSLSK